MATALTDALKLAFALAFGLPRRSGPGGGDPSDVTSDDPGTGLGPPRHNSEGDAGAPIGPGVPNPR